jgi:hypothetical protein
MFASFIARSKRSAEFSHSLNLAGALFSANESAWRVFGAGHAETPGNLCQNYCSGVDLSKNYF